MKDKHAVSSRTDLTARTPAKGPWSTMSLCWFCVNAVPSPQMGAGCSWSSRRHIPVPGWKAERRDKFLGYQSKGRQLVESYLVIECPEFKEG